MTDGSPSDALSRLAQAAAGRGLPPVHLWNPDHCGDIDVVIGADGVWRHEGSPIRRPELVRLFSTVLRKDGDDYCLVTPVEKLTLKVEDLPFRALLMRREGDDLIFTTDVGDEVRADEDHAIQVDVDPATGEPRPRLHVRRGLHARIARSVFYDLVETAEAIEGRMVVRSGGAAFDLGPAA